jgi:hypothetical protein
VHHGSICQEINNPLLANESPFSVSSALTSSLLTDIRKKEIGRTKRNK